MPAGVVEWQKGTMSERWTASNGRCFFCGKVEHGYALKEGREWHPACWPCCRKRVQDDSIKTARKAVPRKIAETEPTGSLFDLSIPPEEIVVDKTV